MLMILAALPQDATLLPPSFFLPQVKKTIVKNAFFLCWTPVRGKLKNLLTDETVGKATASVFLFCFQGRCLWMYLDWYICAITVILRKKANLKWPRNDLCCNKIKKFYFSAKSLIGTGVTGIFTDNANHPNDTLALVLRVLSPWPFWPPDAQLGIHLMQEISFTLHLR